MEFSTELSKKLLPLVKRLEQKPEDCHKTILKFGDTWIHAELMNFVEFLNSGLEQKIVNIPGRADWFSLRRDSFGRRVIVKRLKRNHRKYGQLVEVFFQKPNGRLHFQGLWHTDEVFQNKTIFTKEEKEGLSIRYQNLLNEDKPKSRFKVNSKMRPRFGAQFVKSYKKPKTLPEKRVETQKRRENMVEDLLANIMSDE